MCFIEIQPLRVYMVLISKRIDLWQLKLINKSCLSHDCTLKAIYTLILLLVIGPSRPITTLKTAVYVSKKNNALNTVIKNSTVNVIQWQYNIHKVYGFWLKYVSQKLNKNDCTENKICFLHNYLQGSLSFGCITLINHTLYIIQPIMK